MGSCLALTRNLRAKRTKWTKKRKPAGTFTRYTFGLASVQLAKCSQCCTLVYQMGIRPRMFKSLVGKGHPEFATMRQQDALEFFQYLMNMVQQKERGYPGASKFDPSRSFQFKVRP